ncbi:MAG: hypothetical protein LBR63_14890 [Citrobacter amalonaticus]|jgi:hypothetical protein|nr:hypothetical protein [Citrobacter amalonaticus]
MTHKYLIKLLFILTQCSMNLAFGAGFRDTEIIRIPVKVTINAICEIDTSSNAIEVSFSQVSSGYITQPFIVTLRGNGCPVNPEISFSSSNKIDSEGRLLALSTEPGTINHVVGTIQIMTEENENIQWGGGGKHVPLKMNSISLVAGLTLYPHAPVGGFQASGVFVVTLI